MLSRLLVSGRRRRSSLHPQMPDEFLDPFRKVKNDLYRLDDELQECRLHGVELRTFQADEKSGRC